MGSHDTFQHTWNLAWRLDLNEVITIGHGHLTRLDFWSRWFGESTLGHHPSAAQTHSNDRQNIK